MREVALRQRLRRRRITLALVFLPVLVAGFYGLFIAAPRYGAESRFSVRSISPQGGGPAGMQTLLATGGSMGMGGGFVDGWAVNDFLMSRDAMHQLDRKIGLRRYLARDGFDPFNRMPRDASDDQLYSAYRSAIGVSYSLIEQVDVMRVSAYSPQDTKVISEALVDLAQEFVNTMDQKGVDDALKVSRQAVALAETAAVEAHGALAAWRVRNGIVDPVAESGMLLTLSAQLESQLDAAKVNLEKIRSLNNPEHPMLHMAQAQVGALQAQLDGVRKRMSGKGNTEATRMKSYEALLNAQLFADQNLTVARQNYQQSYTDTLRLERYLSVIARPLPGGRPDSPNLWLLLVEALAAGLVLAFVARMGEGFHREFHHG